MEAFTKATGKMTWLMEKVDSFMLLEIYMMDILKKIRLMAMGNILTPMALNIKDIGLMTYSMGKAVSSGQMALNTKVIISSGKKMAKVNFCMQTNQVMMVILLKTIFMALENISGLTVVNTKETGSMARCMEMALLSGLMVENLTVNILMTISKATVYSHGLMEEGMMVAG